MKTEIHLEDDPLTVLIYERPELKDALSWVAILALFATMFVVVVYFVNPEQVLFGVAIVIVITLPFFVNRFFLRKGSVGGESFKLQRNGGEIVYRNRRFLVDTISFEITTKQLNYQNMYELYLLSSDEEIKLRMDFAVSKENSVTYQLGRQITNHLGIEVRSTHQE